MRDMPQDKKQKQNRRDKKKQKYQDLSTFQKSKIYVRKYEKDG